VAVCYRVDLEVLDGLQRNGEARRAPGRRPALLPMRAAPAAESQLAGRDHHDDDRQA